MRESTESTQALKNALAERFGEDFDVPADLSGAAELLGFAAHRSHRDFADRSVAPELLRLVCACALSAPSKSDLQQADVVHVADPAKQRAIGDLIPSMPWIRTAPVLLIFCGNNRRIRQIADLRGKPFANDHLDAFFNASVDAGIVLGTFVRAAAIVGLGCCPISNVRNHAAKISDLLELPDWVFPVAGLAMGYPSTAGQISPRLPLRLTFHRDRFDESELEAQIDAYDQRRHELQPYQEQRLKGKYGLAELYGWSEDKARQYSRPERADFGAF
ncbi:MAG: nitroreductase family protein, partial [Chloroflexi bacterium]|nr:nitroreductase family protein [Chloroflexota bacterium]